MRKNTARGQDKIESEMRREEAWRERRGEVRASEQSEKTVEEDGEAKRRVITREDKRGSDDMDITDQIDPEKWKKFMKKQDKDEHGKPLEKIDVTVTQPSSSSSNSDAPAAPPVATSTTVPLSARLP